MRITEAHDYDVVGTLPRRGPAPKTDALRADQHRFTGPRAGWGFMTCPGFMMCPICKKVEVSTGDPEFPFCSERCRTIDLGNWALEKYRIPATATVQPEEDEDG